MAFINENVRKSFLFNLGIVLLLCAILYSSFFATLHWVTRHGEEIKIPNIRGTDMTAAIAKLKEMNFEVYIDSTYEPSMKPLTVLKQVPDTGSIVKEGRTVFITVNMLVPPRIPMPSLVNLSYRSAEMLLRNNKLMVGDTTYKPDIASGAILQQLYNGQPIQPGEMISQGSKISLVIGNGLGNMEWDVPDVTRLTVDEAMTILNQYNLQPLLNVANQMEQITDTPTAYIIDQSPRVLNEMGGHNRIKTGQFIDLTIMQNPTDHDYPNNTNTDSGVNGDDKSKKKDSED